MNKLFIGFIIILLFTGCIERKTKIDLKGTKKDRIEINNSYYDKDCFSQGYTYKYLFNCRDDFNNKIDLIGCYQEEVINFKENFIKFCTISKYKNEI